MSKRVLKQENRVELALHLTPSLLLSLKVLQMPVLSLQGMIEAEIESNPSLELIEEEKEQEEIYTEGLRSLAEFFPHISQREEEKSYEEVIGVERKTSLFEILMKQIEEKLKDEEKEIGRLIVDALDEEGFLSINLNELIKIAKVDRDKFISVLNKVQRFEPPGIATSSIQESLLVQLEMKGYSKESNEYRIIRDFYDDLLHQRYDVIKKFLHITDEDIKNILKNLRELNPKPGLLYTDKEIFYVHPDIIVKMRDHEFHIEINESPLPPIRISSFFLKILENPESYSKELVKFAREKAKRAWSLIEALNRRREFLYKLSYTIVENNIKFFKGETKEINTFSIKEMAEIVGRSSSTVSRAVKNKYIEGPCGIYKLSMFFEKKTTSQKSKNKIVKAIKDIIEKEDKKQPFTDEEIAYILEKKGFGSIARRTISKYRKEMNIPSANKRKII